MGVMALDPKRAAEFQAMRAEMAVAIARARRDMRHAYLRVRPKTIVNLLEQIAQAVERIEEAEIEVAELTDQRDKARAEAATQPRFRYAVMGPYAKKAQA
jgi:cell division septum initiation protein DivIVA